MPPILYVTVIYRIVCHRFYMSQRYIDSVCHWFCMSKRYIDWVYPRFCMPQRFIGRVCLRFCMSQRYIDSECQRVCMSQRNIGSVCRQFRSQDDISVVHVNEYVTYFICIRHLLYANRWDSVFYRWNICTSYHSHCGDIAAGLL